MREDVIIFVGPIHISSVHHANEYFVYDMIYRGTYLGTHFRFLHSALERFKIRSEPSEGRRSFLSDSNAITSFQIKY